MASVDRELIHRISRSLIFIIILKQNAVYEFLVNRSTGYDVIMLTIFFCISWPQFLVNEISQKSIYKIYNIKSNSDAIWVKIAE